MAADDPPSRDRPGLDPPTLDPPTLDHVVLAGPDLQQAVAWFADVTGVRPVPGGSHVGLGTANYLVGLGGASYLEIIGPDPDQPDPAQPRPFGIDDLRERRIVTWAVATRDIDGLVGAARSAGYEPGEPRAMSRRTPQGELLEWRLAQAPSAVGNGLVPFVIDWGATPHPTTRGLPQTPLLEWRAAHPEPACVRSALAALGVDLHVAGGAQPALTAVVQGRDGPVTL